MGFEILGQLSIYQYITCAGLLDEGWIVIQIKTRLKDDIRDLKQTTTATATTTW